MTTTLAALLEQAEGKTLVKEKRGQTTNKSGRKPGTTIFHASDRPVRRPSSRGKSVR
jgi:hypothetical protein